MDTVSFTEEVETGVELPEYRICNRCVMDVSDPSIHFDERGVCHHCHVYDSWVNQYVFCGETGQGKVEALVDRIKRNGAAKQYDCIIGVSGGVDSTYVAWK